MAVPASNFSELGSWDESVGRRGEARGTFEDTEYQDRVRAAGGTTWFCPSAKIHHRWPTRTVTPSRILRTAFARGRNAFWKDVLIQKEAAVFAPRRDYVDVWLSWSEVWARSPSGRLSSARAGNTTISCEHMEPPGPPDRPWTFCAPVANRAR